MNNSKQYLPLLNLVYFKKFDVILNKSYSKIYVKVSSILSHFKRVGGTMCDTVRQGKEWGVRGLL